MATHVIENRQVELATAVILLLAGFLLLWDSCDRRGDKPPWFLRWATFW